MAQFLGARALGITVDWRLRFVPFGVTVSPLPGVLYVDVGGSVQPGGIDHHQGELGAESASEIALRQPECSYGHLMPSWLRRAEEGTLVPGTVWQPAIVSHFNPDWDAVVASWLIKRLVEDGEFPAAAEALVGYSSEVDQGRLRLDSSVPPHLFAPHLGYLALQNIVRGGERLSSEQQLREGWALVERVVDQVRKATDPKRALCVGDFLPAAPGATRWADDPDYADVRNLLAADSVLFETKDWRDDGRITIRLPHGETGEPQDVPGFVLHQEPHSVLHKYWVRSKGIPFYVCPYGEATDGVFPRVVLSLDPTGNVPGSRRTQHSLRGLGYRLEREEERTRTGEKGWDDRRGRPRFPDGYCHNDDPWYDGRAHGWTIVDSPRSGTRIRFETIRSIATSGCFWQIPVHEARVTLVWVREPDARATTSKSLSEGASFGGMAESLTAFYGDLTCEMLPAPQAGAEIPGFVGRHRRTLRCSSEPCFDPTLEVLRLRVASEPGRPVTLEDLVRHVKALPPPDYSFVRVRIATHFSPRRREESLLAVLAGGALTPLEGAVHPNAQAFFNSHGLLLRHEGMLPDAEPADAMPQDPAEELLLYVALTHEAVSRFSKRIANLVRDRGVRSLDAEKLNALRADFIRFQSRDFTLNVSRTASVQEAFHRVAAAIGLRAHYHEVQSGLRHLAEFEAQVARERLDRASSIGKWLLSAITVAGLLQSVVAVATWTSPWRWLTVGFVLVAALAAWTYVEFAKKKR
jgi:hypothetical protein